MAESPLATAIKLLLQMEATLSPEQFISWLDARPGSETIYLTFVATPHIEEPSEPVITESTTIAQAFPMLAKQHAAWLATQSNTYRPTNGDGRYAL